MIQWNNLQKLLSDPGKKTKLSKATGISTGNISDWFNPNKPAQPSADALYKIAEFFECSVDYLLGLTDVEKRVTSKSNIIPIPILEQKAAAGLGIETNDYSEYIKEYRFFDKTQIPGETELGIIIEGDSMETTFKNGQVIFVKKLDDCDHNDYGIFCITEDETTRVVFKRKTLLDDGTYCLRSINPDYKDIGGFNEIKMCRCVAKMVLKS
jgi:transcriptional regulator with XRE-family HTH domain